MEKRYMGTVTSSPTAGFGMITIKVIDTAILQTNPEANPEAVNVTIPSSEKDEKLKDIDAQFGSAIFWVGR